MVRPTGMAALFRPIRRLAGPLHRRRPALESDQNEHLPPLPAPWEDDRWFRGGSPPRRHNHVKLFPHGDEYFGDLHAALLAARERVTICGWFLTPLMPLLRGDREDESAIARVLREVSNHAEVYVLLWSGAPVLFEPTEHMVEEVRQTLLRIAPRVRCELDRSATFSHDHHQKAVTIDGRIAYVGGMDLTTFQGDRWDTAGHPLRFGPNWHDVQIRLEGEVVRDVENNFCQRWNSVTGEHVEPLATGRIEPSWNVPVQVIRTVPAGFYPFSPDGEFGIYHALTSAIRRAERFVYLENQYIWAPEIVQALIDAMNRPRSEPFRVVLVLPARAEMGRYDNDEHVRLLSTVDKGRGIFHAYTPYAGGPAIGATGYGYAAIYVHAKVSIVDDEWFSVGSANLNRRGLALDSEMNVHSVCPTVARSLRIRLWAEHLGRSEEEIAGMDPLAVIDGEWRTVARRREECLKSGSGPAPGQMTTYVPARNPVSRLLDWVQQGTLEH